MDFLDFGALRAGVRGRGLSFDLLSVVAAMGLLSITAAGPLPEAQRLTSLHYRRIG